MVPSKPKLEQPTSTGFVNGDIATFLSIKIRGRNLVCGFSLRERPGFAGQFKNFSSIRGNANRHDREIMEAGLSCSPR